MDHVLIVTKRDRGRDPISGRTLFGTSGRCTCREWSWYTNEVPPSRGGRKAAEKAHSAHVESVKEA